MKIIISYIISILIMLSVSISIANANEVTSREFASIVSQCQEFDNELQIDECLTDKLK